MNPNTENKVSCNDTKSEICCGNCDKRFKFELYQDRRFVPEEGADYLHEDNEKECGHHHEMKKEVISEHSLE